MKRILLASIALSSLFLLSTGLIAAAGTTTPPVSTGPRTLTGFGGSPGAHEYFRQPGSSWKGDITGVGAGPVWSLVIEGIDVTGVTGPADRFIYFNLQDSDSGSHFKNLGINVRLDATGAAGGTLFQAYQQWTSEGVSSHGLDADSGFTPDDFDLRLDFTKSTTADAFTYTPYYRLAGQTAWTEFVGGSFTATVGGVDWNSGKLMVGFDGGADGVVSFGNYYLTRPIGTLEVRKVLLGEGGDPTATFSGTVTGPDGFAESFDDLSEDTSTNLPDVLTGDYTVEENDPAGVGGGYGIAGYALATDGACPAEPTQTTTAGFIATVGTGTTTVCVYNVVLEEETRTVIIEAVMDGGMPPEPITSVEGTLSGHGEWSIDSPPGSTTVTGVSTTEHTVTQLPPGEGWTVEYAMAASPTGPCEDVSWSASPAVVPAGESDYKVCVRNAYTADETPTPTVGTATPTPTIETPTPTVGSSTPTPMIETPTATGPEPTATASESAATPTAMAPATTPMAQEPVATPTATEPAATAVSSDPVSTQGPTSADPVPPDTGSGVGLGSSSGASVAALLAGLWVVALRMVMLTLRHRAD